MAAKKKAKTAGVAPKQGQWIAGAVSKPGALRRSLKATPGEPIPRERLEAAAKEPGKLGQRARLALLLRKLGKD